MMTTFNYIALLRITIYKKDISAVISVAQYDELTLGEKVTGSLLHLALHFLAYIQYIMHYKLCSNHESLRCEDTSPHILLLQVFFTKYFEVKIFRNQQTLVLVSQ